uniref:Uncharacterized protein n=1 Tax=Populus alba TaxID=43335 RepID=A0A4U5QKZ7_POPAL|nr:hypothetical protein D5086_0000078360 [Populus alba]
MAKSKKKSSVMRSAQRDYDSNPQRTLSWSISPDIQRPSSSPSPPSPPRTTVAFTDIVNLHHQSRVRTKNQNRGLHSTPSTAQSVSSPQQYGLNASPSVSIRPHHGLLDDPGSSNPWPGVRNPNPEASPRVAVSSPPHMFGKAPTE